jgi:cytochrome c1
MRTRIALAIVLVSAAALGVGAWNERSERQAQARAYAAEATGGDFQRGRDAILAYGCSSCHTIPGIPGADALVGPPLDRIGARTYIAGVLQNNPENMVQWILDPPAVDPLTAMPKLGLSEREARDVATYLNAHR